MYVILSVRPSAADLVTIMLWQLKQPPCWLQNNKDYFDQSLDEIKLLKYINEADPEDEHGMLRLFDYFYYKVRFSTIMTCTNTH